ncbi:MAG: RNA polymerase sigma factor [Limisphaerales bacterium]
MPADDTIATRASLLVRLKDRGDQASWQEFFDTYWRLIYSVARKAGLSEDEAQDVVQETVIAVAQNVGALHYDPKVCSFKTWMLQVTRWRISDRFRQRQREAAGLGRQIHRIRSPGASDPAAPASDEADDGTGTLDGLPDPAAVDLERIWDAEWRQSTIQAALESVRQQITPEQFQLFHLYAIKQLPVKQVARTAGVSVGSVYLAKFRVGALFKKEIERLEAMGVGRGGAPG